MNGGGRQPEEEDDRRTRTDDRRRSNDNDVNDCDRGEECAASARKRQQIRILISENKFFKM